MNFWKNSLLNNIIEEIDCFSFEEQWVPIKGYERFYEISNYGRVKSLDRFLYKMPNGGDNIRKSRIKIQRIDKDGYLIVVLSDENKIVKHRKVHRLMLQSFNVPNSENRKQVNHKDGNKKNNRLYNLEWNTQSENQLHARDNGLNSCRGENHPDSKFTNNQVVEIFNSDLSVDELAIRFNAKKHWIYNIKCGKTYGHLTKKKYVKKDILSNEIVIDIFTSVLKPKELSGIYSISMNTVYRIKNKERYKKVTCNL